MKSLTIRRLLCFAAVIAGAVLIGYRGGAAAYLLFWAAVLVPLLALLCRIIFRRSLLATLKVETTEVLRGERVPCTLHLINRGFLPIPEIRIRLASGKLRMPEGEDTGVLCCALRPGESREFSFAPQSLHCGSATVGAESIRVRDYFALTELRLKREEEITVLPRTRHAETLLIAPPQEAERRYSARSFYGDTAPDGQLRAYQYGDDLRRIHWKASAQQGSLIMRHFEPEPKSELVLLPDSRAVLSDDPAGWFAADSILEGTLCIADYYLRQEIVLRIIPDARRSLSLYTASDFPRLQQLCGVDYFTGAERPDELLERDVASGGSGPYIILTTTVDEPLLQRLQRCIARGVQVILLCVGVSSGASALTRAQTHLSVYYVNPQHDIFSVLSGSSEGGV